LVVNFIYDFLEFFNIKQLSQPRKSKKLNESEQSYVTYLIFWNKVGNWYTRNQVNQESLAQVVLGNFLDVCDQGVSFFIHIFLAKAKHQIEEKQALHKKVNVLEMRGVRNSKS
jgi:hypothetical protein